MPPGLKTATLTVRGADDNIAQGAQSLDLGLQASTGYGSVTRSHSLAILDDDVTAELTSVSGTVLEGGALGIGVRSSAARTVATVLPVTFAGLTASRADVSLYSGGAVPASQNS